MAAAYNSTYDLYHGFIVKQMFQHSFEASPEVSVILRQIDGHRETDAADDEVKTVSTKKEESIDNASTIDGEPIPDEVVMDANPLDHFISNISREWIKLEKFLNQCTGHSTRDRSKNAFTTKIPQVFPAKPLDAPPKRDISFSRKTVEEEIPSFGATFQPVLDGLDGLIDNLNMKDPSKC